MLRLQNLIPKPLRLSILFASLFFANGVDGDDWKSIRGNDGTGRWAGSTILSKSEQVGMRIRWKKKIGSGYSSVVVADGKAITMYTDGENDLATCFNVKNGNIIWSKKLEPIYKGSNGSFDGPIATPVIHEKNVFCLSARGRLFAFDLDSGEQRWARDLIEEEKAVKPLYGFSTTPLVSGDTLCVLAGTPEGALIGLDTKTGTTKWRAGNGTIASQIPMLTKIDGKEVVVSGAGRKVIGVDPDAGKLLFDFEHKGSNGSAMMPVPFGKNEVLLTNDDSFSRAFKIQSTDNGFDVSESWTNRSIKNTYNVPVAKDGHFYAYSTRILTCVDQSTGKPKWKSRKPGDGFLIEVDGHLIIVTKKGSLHVAKIDSQKYNELASVKVFDNLVWAIPAYADNAVFVRSLNEIACVEFVNRSDTHLAGNQQKLYTSRTFLNFLQKAKEAEGKESKQEVVNEFLKSVDSFPMIEEGIAHFLYQGEADDVALACDVFGARQEEKMIRVKGTNLFYYTLRLPADQRVSYVFLKNYKPIIDPRNPRKMTSSMYAGEMEFAIRLRNEKPLEMSWFGMSKWEFPSWLMLHRKKRLAGKLIDEKIKVESGVDFETSVYLPPQYDKKDNTRYPVVYVHDGEQALKLGEIDEAADLYFQSNPERAAILVFLKSAPVAGMDAYLNQVANSVVPFIDKKYRTKADRKYRANYGVGFASGYSLSQTAKNTELFGACSIQSPLVFDQARKMAIEGFQRIDDKTRLYLEWGRYDMHNPVENWDIRDMAKTMHQEFKKNPKVIMSGGQVNDSTDWPSWRLRFDKVMDGLFPQE